jgi:hypothetical protein
VAPAVLGALSTPRARSAVSECVRVGPSRHASLEGAGMQGPPPAMRSGAPPPWLQQQQQQQPPPWAQQQRPAGPPPPWLQQQQMGAPPPPWAQQQQQQMGGGAPPWLQQQQQQMGGAPPPWAQQHPQAARGMAASAPLAREPPRKFQEEDNYWTVHEVRRWPCRLSQLCPQSERCGLNFTAYSSSGEGWWTVRT